MKLPKEIVEKLYAQAEAGLPNEVCGYLAGKDGQVTKHYELRNVDQSPEHFTMDPKEQFAAIKDARGEGLSILVCYHSHPETPARPSDEDIRLANDKNMSYVIVSLANNQKDIKSFKIDNQSIAVIREELEVI